MLRLVGAVNNVVWGAPAMALILGVGLLLSVLCRFPQLTRFRLMLRKPLGKAFRKPASAANGAVSPFQAMCTALAASLGTGNIAGVAGAIALGGPGAVFWMWVSALLGMCTKFAEVTLAVHFRRRNSRGEWAGGPMYYIEAGLGRPWRWLAVLFAVFGALASFGIGNMAQVNTIVDALHTAVAAFIPVSPAAERLLALGVGGGCAAFALTALVGGMKRIGALCSRLIPPLALAYVAASLAVIAAHGASVPAVLALIVKSAFQPQAVCGGAAGITLRAAISQGVGRGVFSNEAGLGSAPIAHAAADVAHPAEQGLYGMLEVFIDTIVVCTMTALVILLGVDRIPYGTQQGASLAIQGFQSVFGPTLPGVLVAASLILFALPTILTWGLYGTRCVQFLFGDGAGRLYQIIFALCSIVGAAVRLESAWLAADTLNGLMSIPNLAALLALSPTAARLANDYFARTARPSYRCSSSRLQP